jgi:hypothetical protein
MNDYKRLIEILKEGSVKGVKGFFVGYGKIFLKKESKTFLQYYLYFLSLLY